MTEAALTPRLLGAVPVMTLAMTVTAAVQALMRMSYRIHVTHLLLPLLINISSLLTVLVIDVTKKVKI